MAKAITLRLTEDQGRALSWLLSVNAHRDVEDEIKAWNNLAATGLSIHKTEEERAEFERKARSNHEFYLEKRSELAELRAALDKARGLA